MAKLVIHTRAGRYIERLDARIKAQLIRKLRDLAKNPGAMPGVKPMAGEWSGFYRLRHADLRVIIYTIGPATPLSSRTWDRAGMCINDGESRRAASGSRL